MEVLFILVELRPARETGWAFSLKGGRAGEPKGQRNNKRGDEHAQHQKQASLFGVLVEAISAPWGRKVKLAFEPWRRLRRKSTPSVPRSLAANADLPRAHARADWMPLPKPPEAA